MCRRNAASIEPKLMKLILIAHDTDLALWKRLKCEWDQVRNQKAGFIQSKRYLLDYLLELIKDVELYIEIQKLDPEDKLRIFNEMSSPERFWFQVLFPRWISFEDPKYSVWRPKLASREPRDDEIYLKLLSREIEKLSGEYLWRNIADYTMATDLIVSAKTQTQKSPICVQLTVSRDIEDKKRKWEITLKRWDIERGLFISIKPNQDRERIERLARTILNKSQTLKTGDYLDIFL